MVCTKSPKHKQKQGVHTGARERGGGDTATTFAASGEEALATTCCESVRGGGWIRRARIGVDGELSTTRGDAVALAENRAVLDFATTGARRVTTTNSTRHTDITCDERTARAILRTARALTP